MDPLYTKAAQLEVLTHRSFREEPDVARVSFKMFLKCERDNEQILDPTMVWSGEQKQAILYEKAGNFTNEPLAPRSRCLNVSAVFLY